MVLMTHTEPTEVVGQASTVHCSDRDSKTTLPIAIIGLGPRGLHCLELLIGWLRSGEAPPLSIHIYDPAEYPGAGAVYDPRDPEYLLMNYAAGRVDEALGSPRWGERGMESFRKWVATNVGVQLGAGDYPARHLVGKYLYSRFLTAKKQIDDLAACHCRREPVQRIVRAGNGWLVSSKSGEQWVEVCVVTVGHGSRWRCEGSQGQSKVFPIQRNLSTRRVPPNSRVGVRGQSLTFIDACLALTVGRGGTYELTEDYHYRYQPGGNEPRVIVPYSRTGRLMLPKPKFDSEEVIPTTASILECAVENLNKLRDLTSESFLSLVCETSDALLRSYAVSSGRERIADGTTRRWYSRWSAPVTPAQWRLRLSEAYQTAVGRRRLDAGWALGEVWRRLYPAIVAKMSHHHWTPTFPDFKVISAELERIAFGPPAENMGKLLALVDAGVLCTEFWGKASKVRRNKGLAIETQGRSQPVDCLIDAVLPSGSQTARSELCDEMLAAINPLYSRTEDSLVTTEAGQLLSGDHQPLEGLYVLGRATEGLIIGHDTLNRQLHQEPDNWIAELKARYAWDRLP